MTEEISYYDEDLTELITEIERGIDGLRKLSPVAKNQARAHPLSPSGTAAGRRRGRLLRVWIAAHRDAAPLGSASTSCRAGCRERSRCCRRSRWR